MLLKSGLHLAYCTNVHPGRDWTETFASLNEHTLRVKEQVAPAGRYAIGLRLSARAARELAEPQTLRAFRHWLDAHDCYVFTINGFPYGEFHGTRVKEQVYRPDWTTPERLDYTLQMFELLAALLPDDVAEGSVSTLPGSFKEFVTSPGMERQMRDQFWRCVEAVAQLSERTGKRFHLGVEPEPLGWFEDTAETVKFFEQLRAQHPKDERLERHLGVTYDTCHFALQYESPAKAMADFQEHGIFLSKIHFSNALKLHTTPDLLSQLADFADDVYLHQVIVRHPDGSLDRFRDLPPALRHGDPFTDTEWRVHFHVPLHWTGHEGLETTSDHVLDLLGVLKKQPQLCSHAEMETYTWAVLPEPLRARTVAEQLVAEYDWMLARLQAQGLA